MDKRKWDAQLEKGYEFEDYASPIVYGWGIFAPPFRSAAFQGRHGESMAGVEYKRDCEALNTRNLFIEVAERRETSQEFHHAGPFHKHRPTWICIGEVDDFAFLLDAHVLIRLINGGRLARKETPTAIGHIFPIDKALTWATRLHDPRRRWTR